MRITRLRIENFRSIKDLELELDEATVFLGPNNAGKSAILDSVRIVLTRRWGQRGTGFTENDVHRPDPDGDPRKLPPIRITLVMEELEAGQWDPDMVAALDDIIVLAPDGRNVLTIQVCCAWSEEKETFDPAWVFLNPDGEPLPERRRAINLTGFFSYMPLFWLGPIRDASAEFKPHGGHWGRLLRSVKIPPDLQEDALRILSELDERLVDADPKLTHIAEMIGEATKVAIGEGPGAARLNTMPLGAEDLLQRTGIVLRNEQVLPWLPLGHHGQGLQSLAVIFLFQAAVLQQLAESERPGAEPVFALEEPEAHLHPQAARTLWERMQKLAGQKLMTTHSPYFVQHVPLRALRLVRLNGGCTEYSSLPRNVISTLPWNDDTAAVAESEPGVFARDDRTNCVAARTWFNVRTAARLSRCFRNDPARTDRQGAVRDLRHACRVLPTLEDEELLSFHGRRIRGEVFFARRWVLVEGVTEYMLLHALGRAFEWPLDTHGIAVIDFQQSGHPGIYAALAEGFGIPWNMIVDGDAEGERFRTQLLRRGFEETELNSHVESLPAPNTLEDQLLADGHEGVLREVLAEIFGDSMKTCTPGDLLAKMKKKKTRYMSPLSLRVAADANLAREMPAPFVSLLASLREGGT